MAIAPHFEYDLFVSYAHADVGHSMPPRQVGGQPLHRIVSGGGAPPAANESGAPE